MEPPSTINEPTITLPAPLSCTICARDSANESEPFYSGHTSNAYSQLLPPIHPPLQATIAWSKGVKLYDCYGSYFEIRVFLPRDSIIFRTKGLVALLFEEAFSTLLNDVIIRNMSVIYYGDLPKGYTLSIRMKYNAPCFEGFMSGPDGEPLAAATAGCGFQAAHGGVTYLERLSDTNTLCEPELESNDVGNYPSG